MTKEEYKAKASMAYGGMETWEEFLEAVWQLHLQASNHWIPVEERLPPKMDKWTKASDYVLVYTNEGEWLIGRYWHDGDGWSVSGFTKAKVTHWMEIVPPRKEE